MWIIEPAIAKKVINYDIWTKNGYTVTTARYWRWAEVCIDNLTCPVIDVRNPDGINIWDCFKNEYENNTIQHNLIDNYDSVVVDYSKGMRSKMKDDIYDIWESDDSLKNNGWIIETSELWFHDVLNLRETEHI